MNNYNKKGVIEFINTYFKSMNLKFLFIWALVSSIYGYIIIGKENIFKILIVILFISIIAHYIRPNYLKKETLKAVENFYKDNEFKNNVSVSFVCNNKKIDGPTFGILEINKNTIKFIPFKSNLQDENFIIDLNNLNKEDILLTERKWALLDKIFFKKISKIIKIKYDSKKVILQMPYIVETFEILKKYIK
ncbi:MAG: hypothetical protein FH753_06850 [Firmicutes bacterium]|nr:hypothetical protein [Bacillota bacterium]